MCLPCEIAVMAFIGCFTTYRSNHSHPLKWTFVRSKYFTFKPIGDFQFYLSFKISNLGATLNPCLPLPVEVSCSLADHIQGILAGFAEQSKTSVLHMSSLYHAFLLCQVCSIPESITADTFELMNDMII